MDAESIPSPLEELHLIRQQFYSFGDYLLLTTRFFEDEQVFTRLMI